MQPRDRLIVALDLSGRDEILQLVDELHGLAEIFKIGLRAFVTNGPAIVQELVTRGERVFLDLKIHDIPNTARHAVTEAVALGAAMVTIHTTGGSSMMDACAERQGSAAVLGVTILTSLDAAELAGIGMSGSPLENAVRLAGLAKQSGLRGIVASPHEVSAIRTAHGSKLLIVTPGIRPDGGDPGDQRRTMTPAAAIEAGADYVVVGRPITDAANRRDAALRILDELA
jgi:orotidine-5'-phosphate decarboxylase